MSPYAFRFIWQMAPTLQLGLSRKDKTAYLQQWINAMNISLHVQRRIL